MREEEREYRVTWEIDVDATSPEEAARKALEMQRDPASTATVFTVDGQEIDLGEDAQKAAMTRTELVRLARAAGQLWDSTSGDDPYNVLSSAQRDLLDRAGQLYPAVPAEDQDV